MKDIFARPLRVDIGGGKNPRPGHVNVDQIEGADVRMDLDDPHLRLPWLDATVEELYSSHCLEHLGDYKPVLHEMVRVCKEGARVEIRVPHWLHPMAMCAGHRHTFCAIQIDHWCNTAIECWFGGCARRLKHHSTQYTHGPYYARGRQLYTDLPMEELMECFPGACHEYIFLLECIENTVCPGGNSE